MTTILKRLDESASFIKSKISTTPEFAVVLGSGLGDFVNRLSDKVEISYDQIPGFKKTNVIGHAGKLVIGKISDKTVAVMQGRIHFYEGHSLDEVTFPVRVLGRLGIKNLLLTNAAGGVNKSYHAGQLILLKDHINLTGNNPLIGPNIDELGTRFPDMSYAWDPKLRNLALKAAAELNYNLVEGVYASVLGPSYETPAEVNMLRTLGADVVGMSTVFENIAAVHMGMNVIGISCVTNMAAGIEKSPLKHEDIKDQANQVMNVFCDLIVNTIELA